MLVQAHEKVRPALQCQTDYKEIYSNSSIPQLSIRMELSNEPDPIGLDSFAGTVRSFKVYLRAQWLLLKAGVLVP